MYIATRDRPSIDIYQQREQQLNRGREMLSPLYELITEATWQG